MARDGIVEELRRRLSPRPKIDHLRKPQIIAAAAEVLYERGLFDTRIGDIAERAGTSSPTILYYFESKDRLLEEAVEYADRVFYERLSEGQGRFKHAGEKLVHLIEETSLGPGGLNDYTLWMEIWVRARRDPSVRRSYVRLDRRQRALIADIVFCPAERVAIFSPASKLGSASCQPSRRRPDHARSHSSIRWG